MDSSILILIAILAAAALLFGVYRFGKKSVQSVLPSNIPSPQPIGYRGDPNVASIRISGGDETVLAEITPVHFPELSLRKTGMLPNPGLAERLNDFLMPARPMLQRVVAQQGTRYLLRFSKETAAMITKGEARLMNATGGGFRAIAVSSQGGPILENAVLVPGGLSNLEKAFIVWELAAIVTLQKFLSDIRKALGRIEMGIMDIKSKMDEQDFAKLHVNYETVNMLANEIGTGKLSMSDVTSYLVNLDNIEKECAQIAKHGYSECQRKAEEMEKLPTTVSGWKEREEKALEIMVDYCRSEYKVLTGNLIAGGSAHIRCLISSNPTIVRERISQRIDNLSENRTVNVRFKEICDKRKEIIGGNLSMEKTGRVYRERFEYASQMHFNELEVISKSTDSYLESMKKSLEGSDSDLSHREIEMTLDSDGKVCEAIAT